MSDPLLHRSAVDASSIDGLKFSKLHSPKMKSVYWRHFGFPVNDNDKVITKQHVVCLLCHKILTNHGNTTNLRAHLQHRHKDLFRNICDEHNIRVPPRKVNFKPNRHNLASKHEGMRHQSVKHEDIKDEDVLRRIKVEYAEDTSQEATQSSTVLLSSDEQSLLYDSIIPVTYDDDDCIDSEHFTKVEVGCPTVSGSNHIGVSVSSGKSNCSSDVEIICSGIDNKVSSGGSYDIEEMDPYQLQDALVNMLVQDIRNVDSLYDAGTANFVRTVSGNIAMPAEKKIESLIREMHSDKLTTIVDQIKMHSQIRPYSLGFDIWTNVEQKHFLSIFFNYTTEAPDYNLLNQLYCTIEYNKFTSIETVFQDFNLQHCTAAIVNHDYDDYLKEFLRSKNIPIILSYNVTVDRCLRNVFSIPTVASIIEEVKDVVMRYAAEISIKLEQSEEIEIPVLNDEFPWTYYDLLEFFAEAISWPDDVELLVASARTIVDCVGTLVVTLDTLKGEEIPHSSMLSPITAKIISKRLIVKENDDEFVANIKQTITAELEKFVLTDNNLTISALLDPRFHRLTNVNDPATCLQILTEKYQRICELEGIDANAVQIRPTSKPKHISSKKSNLELFFGAENASITEASGSSNKPCVESDLNRYRTEVYVGLDESPFVWWNKMGHLYNSIRTLAVSYQCVPCVVNMNFKKPIKQQIYEFQKRFMLCGNLIDAILFLHYHSKDS